VFNMGCGFCAIVPNHRADAAVALLARRHPGAAVIGRLSDQTGLLTVPDLGLWGSSSGLHA
jgi:phosphoribosylformylglycinamidine cyclo-ligase